MMRLQLLWCLPLSSFRLSTWFCSGLLYIHVIQLAGLYTLSCVFISRPINYHTFVRGYRYSVKFGVGSSLIRHRQPWMMIQLITPTCCNVFDPPDPPRLRPSTSCIPPDLASFPRFVQSCCSVSTFRFSRSVDLTTTQLSSSSLCFC